MRVVHRVRTSIRRVEAFVHALPEEYQPAKLLTQLAMIRKAAGGVRDVDVHLAIVKSLNPLDCGRELGELRRYLVAKREKRERRLSKAIEAQLANGLERRIRQARVAVAVATATSPSLDSVASELVEKARAARNASGLHEFRLACKRLRYTAELAPESPTRELLISKLVKVQDVTGEWHDTLTLSELARKLFGNLRPLNSILDARCRAKLNEALRVIPRAVKAVVSARDLPPRKLAPAADVGSENQPVA